jgi:hypothetical protein
MASVASLVVATGHALNAIVCGNSNGLSRHRHEKLKLAG